MSLSKFGHKVREELSVQGIELTPDELEEGIREADERIGYGACVICGKIRETRYGMCFDCFMKED